MIGSIAFIVRKKSNSYHLCADAIRTLEIPAGYKAEIITIEASSNTAVDRQRSMRCCQADYKIYLEDNALLLDEKFVYKVVETFQQDERIGLIGIAGTNIVPTNGIAIASQSIIGEFVDQEGKRITGSRFSEGNAKDVKTVFGAVLATRYDFDWPEEYATSCFCDTAYSLNIQRKGYRCAVIPVSVATVWTGDKSISVDNREQTSFLNQYAEDLYPLVSILIPSFNRPVYLKEAINSALTQTYKNIEVIVVDHSTDTKSKEMVQENFIHDKRLHYEFHPEFSSPENGNYVRAYNNPKADYVNWLMDDDLFAPNKIARMIDCYRENPHVSLVTSYRACIDENGRRIPDLPYTKPLADHDVIFSGKNFGRNILMTMTNRIGELTTCLIKKSNLLNGDLGFSGHDGKYMISDVPTWLHMCSIGDIAYLTEPLSYVRIHRGQHQNNQEIIIQGTICWAMLLDHAFKNHIFFDSETDKSTAIKQWFLMVTGIILNLNEENISPSYRDLKRVLSDVAKAFNNEQVYDLSYLQSDEWWS